MTDLIARLVTCDSEPIHIPGSIQPHGIMLVADREALTVRQGAGDIEHHLGIPEWNGRTLAALLGERLASRIGALVRSSASGGFAGQFETPGGEILDVSAHPSAGFVLVELEPSSADPLPASQVLDRLEQAAMQFERAESLQELCDRAAREFRLVTGFDRVMVYYFLDDGVGRVLAEDRRQDLRSFLNHHFPASDIPSQARALYVRNLVRVIPDASYRPAPLRPDIPGTKPLDLSDSALRSVSPIHLQYLKNMEVVASASVSIVMDGKLWGLIACHHETPHTMPFDVRSACRALAGALARRIKANEEAESYRQRISLRHAEDEIVEMLTRESSVDRCLHDHLGQFGRMLDADGMAVLNSDVVAVWGNCPPKSAIRALAEWIGQNTKAEIFSTDRLGELYPPALKFPKNGSGVLAMSEVHDDRSVILWFRAEHIEVINWAGNPHKEMDRNAVGMLTPRASFDNWQGSVRGIARGWTQAQIETAARLRNTLLELRRVAQTRELNQRLTETLGDKDALLAQKEFLIGEVNHRVKNSLQLVSSYLALQADASHSDTVQAELQEARRRLSAVELVHRRLYRGDQLQTINLAHYIEELGVDALASMGKAWQNSLILNLEPISLSTDQAVTVGLILSELIININKYAYGGKPGPVEITLRDEAPFFTLIVADKGTGNAQASSGFGTRMMEALAGQLDGTLAYGDNQPGLRAVLTAPIGRT